MNQRRSFLDDVEHARHLTNDSLPSNSLRHKCKHEANHSSAPVKSLRKEGEALRNASVLVSASDDDGRATGWECASDADRGEGRTGKGDVGGATGDGEGGDECHCGGCREFAGTESREIGADVRDVDLVTETVKCCRKSV